jgi:hypothetical protein
MTPIIGITASSITSSMLGSYDSIATVSVTTATQANIEFTNIPQTYTHLQVRFINLQDSTENIWMQFNGDTATNYSWHDLFGDGASAASAAGTNDVYFKIGYVGSTSASFAGAGITDVLDYRNTNKYKTARALAGTDVNGSGGYVLFRSGNWRNTNAITSIKILPTSGNFKQYSHFALYGIKG